MKLLPIGNPRVMHPCSPRVSIILPTYNGGEYLRKSIQSVLDQTLSDWELIIVDDCSTDITPEIIKNYTDPRIHYTRNGVNCKLPRSLNRGFALSAGSYLTWTSDDNWYAPDALERMVNALDSHRDIGLVCASYYYVDENDNVMQLLDRKPPIYLAETNVVGACFLYRRCVLNKVGAYDPEKVLVEDYDYWLRINKKFRIAMIRDPLYYYRLHSSSLTETEGASRIDGIAEALRKERCSNTERIRLSYYKTLQRLSTMMNNRKPRWIIGFMQNAGKKMIELHDRNTYIDC